MKEGIIIRIDILIQQIIDEIDSVNFKKYKTHIYVWVFVCLTIIIINYKMYI